MSPSLLILDHNEDYRSVLQDYLSGMVEVFLASNTSEALETLSDKDVEILFVEEELENQKGVEFLKDIKEQYPCVVRVLYSSPGDLQMLLEAINQGEVFRCFFKPGQKDEIVDLVRECIRHGDSIREKQYLRQQIDLRNDQLRKYYYSLDREILERNHLLRLSKKILEDLPFSLIIFNKEGKVEFSNDKAKDLLSRKETEFWDEEWLKKKYEESKEAKVKNFDFGEPLGTAILKFISRKGLEDKSILLFHKEESRK